MQRICRLFVMFVIWKVVPCAYAENVITFDAYAAWDGYSKPNMQEEITLTIQSTIQTFVSINIINGNNSAKTQQTIFPDRNNHIKVVIPTVVGDHFSIVVSAPDKRISVSKDIDLQSVDDNYRLIAIATNAPAVHEIVNQIDEHDVILTSPPAELFPTEPAVYEPISVIIIDNATIMRFNSKQLSALQSYISACGILYAYQLDERILKAIRENNNCANQNIFTLNYDTKSFAHRTTRVNLKAILKKTAEQAASNFIIHQLIFGFVAIIVYFLVVILMRPRVKSRTTIIFITLSAIFIYIYYLYIFDEKVAGYSVLSTNIHGAGQLDMLTSTLGGTKAVRSISLSSKYGIAQPDDSKLAYTIDYDKDKAYNIAYRQPFLKPSTFYLSRAFFYKPNIHVSAAKDLLHIQNLSNEEKPHGILKWHTKLFSFQKIPANSDIDLRNDGEVRRSTKYESTLNSLLNTCDNCLILDYTDSDQFPAELPIKQHGFILLQY
jgi:hypothetical protein